MKECCRICARELCGNRRRWLFHPAAKLQVLLSHALGSELQRDGRGEFACGKCAFMLERMYRFDTVIARVEALSIERLHKLLTEKDRLRQCIGGMYRRHNGEATPTGDDGRPEKDRAGGLTGLHDVRYCALLQEDLMYSEYESWAEDEEQVADCTHNPPVQASESSWASAPQRRCRGCSVLRVADSDYEAVCRVPRKLARSISCGPSTRCLPSACGEEPTASTPMPAIPTSDAPASDGDRTPAGPTSNSGGSVVSLTTTLDVALSGREADRDRRVEQNSDGHSEEHSGPALGSLGTTGKLALAQYLMHDCTYRPIQIPRGSRLPVLIRPAGTDASIRRGSPEWVLRTPYCGMEYVVEEADPPRIQLDAEPELAELEEMWNEAYVEYMPFCFQKVPKKRLIEDQQSQLNQYECAAGQCVSELQKAQLQVQSLQDKIQDSEISNKKLQESLNEMETELHSIRQAAQSQERTIQSLTESLTTKEAETQELYQVIEGQNNTMCKLREMAHRNQLQNTQVLQGCDAGSVARLQGEVVGLQSSLFCCQLELESSRRAQRQSQREASDLARARDRLHADLDAELQHRETTDRHNQDLRNTVQQLRSELQVKEAQLRDSESEHHSEISARDKTISDLQLTLRDKERLLQEYSELLEQPADTGRGRDALLDKLKSRIRERDKALERAIDEKFYRVEEKESEVRRLQLALREKERDLERLRYILSNNEETITSLDALVRSKELEAEQNQEACRKLQCLKDQCDRNHAVALLERDSIIKQLHTALNTRSKETEDLTAALMTKGSSSPGGLMDELSSRLALKERLFQELLADRSRQSQEHHTQVQDLLSTISSRDQYIKESGERLRQVIAERAGQLQELRMQLSSREQELSEERRERDRGASLAMEMERVQSILREKESLIQDLMQSQEETMVTSRPVGAVQGLDEGSSELEFQAVKEELQIALRKQKEAERELSELRPLLSKHEDHPSTEYQSTLEQLASEYQQLNQALRAEKKLYQNLSQIQSGGDSAEKTRALHMELDTVQALRGQLEEVLSKTRDTALALDRAAKAQADYGEFSSDEEEEDDEDDDEDGGSSSEEFTDSIEEDDVKLTARSLASTQNAGMSGGPVGEGLSQGAMQGGWQDKVAQKKSKEREIREIKSQLSQAGHTTCSLNRSNLPGQQVANHKLEQSGLASGSVLESESGLKTDGKVSVRCRRWEQSDSDGLRPRGLPRHNQYAHGQEAEEEEYDDEDEDEEGEGARDPRCKCGAPIVTLRERSGKRRCTRPHSLDLGVLLAHGLRGSYSAQDPGVEQQVEGQSSGSSSSSGVGATGFWQHVEAGLREQAERLRSDLALSRQESRELQERLMVSEATVHAQAEQLKDYRELLTETAVQRDSKQVQVDLQDLGYETSGRSENEAERDDASSPEFDDLEMCTSLSREHYGDSGVGGGIKPWTCRADGRGAVQPDDASSLRCLVQDLRAQLSRCYGVIRGLQLRVRSLSATSDYASSLERTPRKVNWALRVSPSHSAVEEDEGWQSDGPAPGAARPSRELQELVSRVASLEEQVRNARLEGNGGAEEGKNTTWPGKYNTLIQAQARELSHLRQRMREGRGICHILTQHLGDTTKAFEELLRANDIDYYMGQSFRKQLSQSTSLAQRISIKINGRDRTELQDDKMGHELLALRLSKELQEKDKIIESLHTKLKQHPDTPSSSRAPSETTDQSDRTSFASDDRGSTNEDLELCSDVDAVSEYAQQEPAPRPEDAGFSLPHSLSSFTLMGPTPIDTTSYTPQLSQHSLGHPLKTDAPWSTDNMSEPIRGLAGTPVYQSGSGHSDMGLIEEHLQEIRTLRQRLEDSIQTNERLRQQLESRLAAVARDGAAPTNIYIQGLDTVAQLSNEIRVLKEENLSLQSTLQTSRDSNKEVEQLQEAVLTGRARLKQAELEAEQWKEELRRVQAHSCEQIQQLRQERQSNQEHSNKLQHEVSLLQQQLSESRQLLHSLQCELQLYDRVCAGNKSALTGRASEPPYLCGPGVGELAGLLLEARAPRPQLPGQLAGAEPRPTALVPASPLRNALYRRQLLHDPSPSPPVRDVGPFPAGPPYSPYAELEEISLAANDSLEPHAELEGEAPDGSFASRNGRHTIGHVDDFSALQQQVLEGRGLVQRMEATLQTCMNTAAMEVNAGQSLDYASVRTLLANTKTLGQILEEAVSLLKMFWRAALPSSDGPAHLLQKEQSMREEIRSLRLKIVEQEEVLQSTIQRLRTTNRSKESMETFIVNQLSRTRDVLKKARANLEKNELRISSLSSSSSSSCHGKVLKDAYPRASDWGGMNPEATGSTANRKVAVKQVRECLLQATS
ncbi:myomegalin-like isoform X2 [Electrophorus electricus]|uniref:myomegalin-like isoform X2 n=1 Tax=Electrophorus electricus TaxID=8005 RepID=UPI0015CFD094|nr:myomegalin-like isoform X2 [Electrophorus electricus]